MAEEKSISETVHELVATLMMYLKQRGAEFVTAVVVEPLRKSAAQAALGCAGLVFLALGIVFLGMFMVHGFAALLDSYVWGYLASAGVTLVIAAILMLIMSRRGKEEVRGNDAKLNDKDGNPDRTSGHQ
jgi:protein-S-isoprenylcysteine O-methyltransferase Ste14